MTDDPNTDQEYSNYVGYASGLIPCDGMNSRIDYKDLLYFIWFLNLASVYRDIALEGQLKNMHDLNHTPESYWLLGCCGPFGIIDQKRNEKVEYKIFNLNEYITPKQGDNCNCAVIWCLFIYDIMMQAPLSYDFDVFELHNYLPTSLQIGKTWLYPKLFEELKKLKAPYNDTTELKNLKKEQIAHNKQVCQMFREEMVICLE